MQGWVYEGESPDDSFEKTLRFLFGNNEGSLSAFHPDDDVPLGAVCHSMGESVADDFSRGADRFLFHLVTENGRPVLKYATNRYYAASELVDMAEGLSKAQADPKHQVTPRYDPERRIKDAWADHSITRKNHTSDPEWGHIFRERLVMRYEIKSTDVLGLNLSEYLAMRFCSLLEEGARKIEVSFTKKEIILVTEGIPSDALVNALRRIPDGRVPFGSLMRRRQ